MRWIEFSSLSKRLLLPALVAIPAMLLLSSCSMDELTETSPQAFPTPMSCAHCHVDIYNEWAASPHAQAFVNPRFVAATDDHRFSQCLGCHAPEPKMTLVDQPAARSSDRDLGVVCVACHLDQGAMVGPLEPTGMVKPHPIRVDPRPFADGQLCGHCHQGTLTQWQAARHAGTRDCRECHMPSVIRKTTQATSAISKVFVAAEEPVLEHRHAFTLVPQELPEPAFTLEVKQAGRAANVAMVNQLPHNLPTGDFGVRVVEVIADGVDANGRVAELGHWELTNAAGRFLAPGARRQWAVNLPEDVRAVRVLVVRHGRDGARRVVMLTKEVAVR